MSVYWARRPTRWGDQFRPRPHPIAFPLGGAGVGAEMGAFGRDRVNGTTTRRRWGPRAIGKSARHNGSGLPTRHVRGMRPGLARETLFDQPHREPSQCTIALVASAYGFGAVTDRLHIRSGALGCRPYRAPTAKPPRNTV